MHNVGMEMPDAQPRYAEQLRRIAALDEQFRDLLARSLDLNSTSLGAMEWLMREGPLTPSELAARLELTPGAVTAVIGRLVATGHAQREAAEGDRRSVRIAPNPASIETATERLLPLIADMSGRMTGYSDEEMAVVHRFLDDVADSYRRGVESLEGQRAD